MYIDDKFVKDYDALIKTRLLKAGLHGDLFDEVRAKVYERVLASNSYDPERGKVSTWLWQICRSVISNEVKKNSRSKDVLDDHPLTLDEISNHMGPEDAGSVEAEVERIAYSAGVSERDMRIMKGIYGHERTYQAVADEEGMTLEAVKKVAYRSMTALRAVAQA